MIADDEAMIRNVKERLELLYGMDIKLHGSNLCGTDSLGISEERTERRLDMTRI